MNKNEDIIYKSKFSITPFIGLTFGFGGFGYVGLILVENHKNIGGIILIIPELFFILSAFSLTALLSLKSVILKQEKMIINYIFLAKKHEIDWNSISYLK